jgi:hypothetical protein
MRQCVFICAILAIALAASSAGATNGHLRSFENAYPAAVGTRIDSCTLCHTTAPARNSYGAAYGSAGRNFADIENADSDGDGFTNLAEISALTFPGNASDKPAATGTDPVPVPDVAGLTRDAAAAAVTAAGLVLGQVTDTPSDTVPAGSVITQTPAAGTMVAPLSAVDLTVSSGPQSAGCAGLSCQKGAFSFDGFTKMLGDLFLAGLALVTLQLLSRKK